jgi:hypothetical protein
MGVASEEELVLEASRAGALLKGALGVAACGAAFFLGSEVRPWGVSMGLGFIAWAWFELRNVERFWVDREARALVTSSNSRLPLASLGRVTLQGPHQEAPNVCEVMVNLGGDRWVPVYAGAPDAARRVAVFVERVKESRDAALRAPAGNVHRAATTSARVEASGLQSSKAKPSKNDASDALRARLAELPRDGSVRERARALEALITSVRCQGKGRAERVTCIVLEELPSEGVGALERSLSPFAGLARDATPGGWENITSSDALARLVHPMSHELAYGYELLDEASASALVAEFVRCFGEGARYFDVPSHVRITQANFDEGVVVCDAACVGMLWFVSDSPGR